jgi:gamma-glutamyl-gamma-aminobutyrate hydrolase PuuD
MPGKRPKVVVVTRRTSRKNRLVDYVGELHLALLIRMRILPVMIPVVDGTLACLPEYMVGMNGLLLVEGEDIHPSRYRSRRANFTYLEKTHPLKDEIEFRLLRHALSRKLPILGICRGSQELNVVCGGTLYGDVRKEKAAAEKGTAPGISRATTPRVKHIEESPEHYDSYRHRVTLVEGTPLARWYGEKTLQVNSYHHQGVRDLASRFAPMAHADDGLVEGFYDPKAPFVVGLQFHPERMLRDYAGNWRVWKEFGAAVHRRARQDTGMAPGPNRNNDRLRKTN